jgi:hypothetical protein
MGINQLYAMWSAVPEEAVMNGPHLLDHKAHVMRNEINELNRKSAKW